MHIYTYNLKCGGSGSVRNLQLAKRAFEVKLDFEFTIASHGFPRMGQGIACLTESISERRIDLMARPIADMGKDRMRASERTNATGEESERGVHQMGFEKPL